MFGIHVPPLNVPHWLSHELANPPGSGVIGHAPSAAWSYLLRTAKQNLKTETG